MQKRKMGAALWLILLCWLVYASSYIGKVNYAANINQVMPFYQVNHSEAGLVSTSFFFAYGIGQIVNGIFCKKYNLKWIVFISLVVSGLVNLIVGVSDNFDIIKPLWLINGLSLSVLWPSLIRLLSETLSKEDMTKASMIIGTAVATGTFIVYGLSALFVKIDFKLSFYLATVVFFLVAALWILSVSKIVGKIKAEKAPEETPQPLSNQTVQSDRVQRKVLALSIVVLAFYGIATNLIKDGLTTWIPSILIEQYQLDDSLSIVLTLALPVVSIFGNAFAIAVHKKISDFVLQCALVFLCAGAIIGGVIGGLSSDQFLITLIGFAIVCFLAASCNSLITNIFPLFMKGKLNSGLFAGILNGCCYLGSMISSYGLGVIADRFSWLSVFWILLAVCVAVCLGAVAYMLIKKFVIKAKTA